MGSLDFENKIDGNAATDPISIATKGSGNGHKPHSGRNGAETAMNIIAFASAPPLPSQKVTKPTTTHTAIVIKVKISNPTLKKNKVSKAVSNPAGTAHNQSLFGTTPNL